MNAALLPHIKYYICSKIFVLSSIIISMCVYIYICVYVYFILNITQGCNIGKLECFEQQEQFKKNMTNEKFLFVIYLLKCRVFSSFFHLNCVSFAHFFSSFLLLFYRKIYHLVSKIKVSHEIDKSTLNITVSIYQYSIS